MDRLNMSVQVMAHQLGVSRRKAYELCKIEGFPVLHIGHRIVIPVDSLKVWLDENAKA